MKNSLIFLLILLFGTISCEQEKPLLKASITDSTTKQEDDSILKQLRQEIDNLAGSKTCINAANWKFTEIGAKACGGPTGFVAYSAEIDEADFLKKVSAYTDANKKYNTKHGIISDCMLLTPPKSISCEAGKPVFNF